MHLALVLLSALAVALGRRVAGGALGQWTPLELGDYPVRFFYGLTVWAAALAGGAAPSYSWVLVPAVFLGCSIPNFGGIAMGRSGNPWWRDALAMLGHGVLSLGPAALMALAPAALVLFAMGAPSVLAIAMAALVFAAGLPGFLALVAAGAFCPAAYEIGWCISGKSGRPGFPKGLQGGSEIGEALWGAGIGAALASVVWA